jgi:hypothetical protein
MRSSARKTKGKRGGRRRAPIAINGTVPPRRMPNARRRPREYLTVKEVGLLMETARKRGRYGHRDATMILIAFRHGLRPAEACALRWDMVSVPLSVSAIAPPLTLRSRECRAESEQSSCSFFGGIFRRAAPLHTSGTRPPAPRPPAWRGIRVGSWRCACCRTGGPPRAP